MLFRSVMRSNLCDLKDRFSFTFECENFLEGTIKEGLHPVIVHFIESMREMLTKYREIKNSSLENINQTIQDELLNSAKFNDMEISIFDIADPALRYLVDELVNSHDNKTSSNTTIRVILFIVFLILTCIIYLALWTPRISRFSNEVINYITIRSGELDLC